MGEMVEGKLEVGIIKRSILVIFSMSSGMHSKVLLTLAGGILNAFCTRMGSICHTTVEIDNCRIYAKIGLNERRVLRTHLCSCEPEACAQCHKSSLLNEKSNFGLGIALIICEI